MNYKCSDLLNDHKPPNHSVRMTNQSSKCNDAENGDKCRYTCMGSIDTITQLDEQFVTLFDYSPDNSDNPLNYTEYTCKTSVKILLKFHGKLLKKSNNSKVRLNYNDGTTFKLITYTEQGTSLCAESIEASCNDERGSDPVGTFTEEFYDVVFTEEGDSVTSSSNFGIIRCLNPTESEDFSTIASRFINPAAHTGKYDGKLEYYGFEDISDLLRLNPDDNSILLSQLVPLLKSMFPSRNINLHLLTCLVSEVEPGARPFTETDIIPSESLFTKSYEWVKGHNNDCEDLPVCSFEGHRGLDLSQCNLGSPKSIVYLDRQDDNSPYQSVDFESSQCILECLPGYRKVILPSKSDRGNCYSYHDNRTLHTEYLNFDNGNLTRLGIQCIPNSCASRL